MKVYQGSVIDRQRSKESHYGQCRAVVEAKSWAAAHRIVQRKFPMSLGHMKNYWSVTGNADQIAAAIKFPGVLLLSTSLTSDDYEPAK